MRVLQNQIHEIAKADARYPAMNKELRDSKHSPLTESKPWLLWVEIYYDSILSLYNSCKKEGLETSCEELKKMFKKQLSLDSVLSKNPNLMKKYEELLV